MNKNLNERCYPLMSPKRVVRDHLSRYNFAAEFVRDKIVLDIACGEGYGSNIFLQAGAKEVYGVDIDPEIISEALKKYPEINFSVQDATKTSFSDEFFDIVVSFETWHYLDNYKKFVEEMSRVVKPGGIFIVSVPNKKVIYPNPFSRKFLTEFYKTDFSKGKMEKFIRPHFPEISWYGQRFVRPFLLNSFVKIMLFLISLVSIKFRKRVAKSFSLGNGPQVLPLNGDNARYLIAVCRKKK